MTREKLNEVLQEYAVEAYEMGEYGKPEPETHEWVEKKIWEAIQTGNTK